MSAKYDTKQHTYKIKITNIWEAHSTIKKTDITKHLNNTSTEICQHLPVYLIWLPYCLVE